LPDRPLGITIISILVGVAGVVFILAGLNFVGVAQVGQLHLFLAVASSLSGQILVLWGIVLSLIAFGLWKLNKLALYGYGALQIFSFIMALLSWNIIAMIVSGIIIFYLWFSRGAFSGEELG